MHHYIKNKEMEYGYTLIEMAGVLFLTGILLVAMIAGYNHTIKKQRANALTIELMTRGASLKKQIDNRKHTFNISHFGSQVLGYNITLPDDEVPTIFVSPLEKNICDLMIKNMQNFSKIIGNCNLSQNTLAFDFSEQSNVSIMNNE